MHVGGEPGEGRDIFMFKLAVVCQVTQHDLNLCFNVEKSAIFSS